MSTTIKRQSTISTSPFNNWTQHAEKWEICKSPTTIGKRILKLKAARKDRPKNNVKNSTWIQCFLNFLSPQIKSDDIPPGVKLDDVNNIEMGKANKSVTMRTQVLFKLFGSKSFKWVKW